MSYGLKEIQTGIYGGLSGDAGLGALIEGVFDHVPDKTDYPYVVIGDARARDWSSHSRNGLQVSVMIHIYSRQGGRKQALEIASRIYELLHANSLSLSGHSVAMVRHEASSIELMEDGRTYHATLEFLLLAQEN